jgi:hypothetical protein
MQTVDTKLHIDCEICVHRWQRIQIHVTIYSTRYLPVTTAVRVSWNANAKRSLDGSHVENFVARIMSISNDRNDCKKIPKRGYNQLMSVKFRRENDEQIE